MSGPPERDAEFVRLGRRLERERSARLEAEAIAEKGLRELWAQQRALTLLETITKFANQERSSAKALAMATREVCRLTDWPLGHVFLTRRTRKGPVMAPTAVWCGTGRDSHAEFRRASERIVMAPGDGLPGRVLESGAPAWIHHIETDPKFPRANLAIAAGLKSALAFPVLVRREVVAVLEFFTTKVEEPDEELLSLMGNVGAQLGRSVERERAKARMEAKNRRLQEVLRLAEAAREAAEQASHAKSAFLAVTSHAIRTPLNVILGFAQALRRGQLGAEQSELVDGILDSSAMLVRLLNEVLELSKIEAGEAELNERPFDLGRAIGAISRIWGAKAQAQGVGLSLDLRGLEGSGAIVADAGKIEQCLVNLVSNALKFTPAGREVRLSARVAGAQAEIVVEDDGPGIAPEDRARILQPYVQTDLGREAGGVGLGLSICAGHMARMGGALEAEESASGGARFILAFPCRLDAPAPEAAEALAPAEPDAPLRVLVAEDNPANRRVIEVLLGPSGVQLSFAENGLEAVQALDRSVFDLILMDANMPVMDGAEAVRTIRARADASARMPIHMLTANAFEEDVRRYLAAGADGVLRKPVDVGLLYELLAAVAAQGAASDRADAA